MVMQSISFHNSLDQLARPYQYYVGGQWQAGGQYVTYNDRNVEYQFFAHFHPYVLALIQRLNEGGVSKLQDSDTLYLPQPNTGQPLTVLPGSTRATLAATVNATRPDGTPVSLSAGTPLTLPDGTTINLPAVALNLTLPGSLPAASSSGIQWTIAGAQTIVPDYAAVTLPNGATEAILANDGTAVNLPNGTAIAIQRGRPKPFFYDDIFDASHYKPDPTNVPPAYYPVKNLDFAFNGAYSLYNWELFFHVPLLIAVHLSQNQKFQDAQNWFHYIRTTSLPGDSGYARSGPDDSRFSDYYGSVQSVVTSSGQMDSGLFETNLRDERYLPFELSGAVSEWRLDLPADVRQFDFDTISDVILHVRYTAREGGEVLKSAAVKNLQDLIKKAQTVGAVRLFSVRHEFPSEWAKFRGVNGVPTMPLSLTLLPQHYPFWAQGVAGNLVRAPLPAAITDATHPPLTVYFDNNSMKDLWIAITWGKA